MQRIACATLAALIAAAPAGAEPINRTGLYFGGFVSASGLGTDIGMADGEASQSDSYGVAQLGGGNTIVSRTTSTVSALISGTGSENGPREPEFSVLAGGSYQIGSFVLGAQIEVGSIEASADAVVSARSSFSLTSQSSSSTNGGPYVPTLSSNLASSGSNSFRTPVSAEWQASAMAIIGFMPTSQLMVYGTGGIARAGFEAAGQILSDDRAEEFQLNGVAYGGGLEWSLSRSFALRAEYRVTDFSAFQFSTSKSTVSVAPLAGAPDSTYANSTFRTVSIDPTIQSIRLGIIYRLD